MFQMVDRSTRSTTEVSTDRIRKVIDRIQAEAKPALPPECAEVHRIAALEHSSMDHEERIRHGETLLSDGKTAFAVLHSNTETMKKSLEQISTTLSRLNWIVITGVVGAVLAMVLKSKVLP